MTMPGFIRQNRPQDGLEHSWAAGSPQGFGTVPQKARQFIEEHRAMAGLDDSDASTVEILRQFLEDSSWSEELKRVWRRWLATLSPSDAAAALFEAELAAGSTPEEAKARLNRDRHLCEAVRADWRGPEPAVTLGVPSRPAVDASTRAAEVFEAALREGCTGHQARDRVNADRRLVEAVDRQWHGQQLGDGDDTELDAVNDARCRALAPRLGLPPSAPPEQIADAVADVDDEDLPGIAAALQLPDGSSRKEIKRAVQRFLRTEPGEPDPNEPVVWRHRADKRDAAELARRHPGYAPRAGTQRAPVPNLGHYATEGGARARLHALAEQRAVETKKDYGVALREVIAEQPSLFERAQAEYF